MRKSFMYIVLALLFAMNITGCSLFSSSDDEQQSAEVAEDGAMQTDGGEGDEFASELGDEFAADDFESGGDFDFDAEAMASDEGSDGGMVTEDVVAEDVFDEYPDDAYSEAGAQTTADAAGDDFSEDFIDDDSFGVGDPVGAKDVAAADDSLFVDEGGGLPADTMSGNQEEDLFGQSMDPVVDTPIYEDSSFAETPSSSFIPPVVDTPSMEEQGLVSVKKMKPAAYPRAGGNVNRLYVVRPGDNMDTIAQKLYGNSNDSERLYSYNSHFRGKTLQVGDKVYYESPNNPNDSMMLTYYEDNNIAPQYYTSQEGDNIRKVSEKLLGHPRSWMEVYATNENVDSKWAIPGGLQLRYWNEDGAPMGNTMAMNEPPAVSEPEPMDAPEPPPIEEPPAMEEPSMAMGEAEKMPGDVAAMDEGLEEPTDVASLDDPEPFPDEQNGDFNPPPAAGSVNNNPPPPKPVAPPPPPPSPRNNMNRPPAPNMARGENPAGDPLADISENTRIMGLLGGLVLLAAIIMLIFIRRSRTKRVNFSQTQV